jgi:type I restriction enzyme M protein
MLTGELRSKIDNVWNAFWAGGIANPLEVIEQITYLLFMRDLDEAHTREENKANRLGKPMERRIFPKGKDKIGEDGGVAYEDMRWSRLKNRDPATTFEIVSEHVFPFLRSMADAGTAHSTHMKGARFTIPTPALLAKVVDLLADIPMEDRDTKGDVYEYMLAKIATAGQNGQFRTPRHIIALMVELMAPNPKDVICDPACGTCGFLVAAGEYLRSNHPKLFQEKETRDHFHEEMFHGFGFDGTMLRIGSMNMTLHGVAPIMSGSTTVRPTASRWTTSGMRCCRRRRSGREQSSAMTSIRRTICPTSRRAGRSATERNASAPAPRKASASQRRRLPPQAMIFRSTVTRRWCTRPPSIVRRRKLSRS